MILPGTHLESTRIVEGQEPGVLIVDTQGTQPGDFPPHDVSEGLVKALQVTLHDAVNPSLAIDLAEWQPPLNASNILTSHWTEFARLIGVASPNYAGFVFLHDVNVMSYTASALSFLLERLSKPVVFTGTLQTSHPKSGSGRVLEENQANLRMAVAVAAGPAARLPLVPEVCVMFGGRLIRGNRARLVSSSAGISFESPQYPLLGKATDDHVEIQTRLLRVPSDQQLIPHDRLIANILSFDIFPGIPLRFLSKGLDQKEVKGVIIRTFGTEDLLVKPGLANEEMLRLIKGAQERGILVVNVTGLGGDILRLRLPEINAKLFAAGAISAADMTPEAALSKLMFLLGRGFTKTDVSAYFQIDLRGEQSINIFNIDFGVGAATQVGGATRAIPGTFAPGKVYRALLRLQGLEAKGEDEGSGCVRVFLNRNDADVTTSEDVPQFAGRAQIPLNAPGVNIDLDVTAAVHRVVTETTPLHVAVITDASRAEWKRMALELYASV